MALSPGPTLTRSVDPLAALSRTAPHLRLKRLRYIDQKVHRQGEALLTLHDYLGVLRRSWVLILVSTVLGALLGVAASLATTPVYQASSQLFVSVKSTGEVSAAYSGGLFVQQRVQSYVDLANSEGVLQPVVEELGLDTTYRALAPQVTAETPKDTVLLNVLVTDTDPAQAARIANATAASFAREIQRLEGANPAGADQPGTKASKADTQDQLPVQATVTRTAEVPSAPIAPNRMLNLALGVFLGFGVGLSIALLRHTLDTSIKSAEDLDKAAGSTPLGTVTFDPEAKSKPLAILRDSPRSEAFRTIRTNLQFVDVDHQPKTVVITSSVPSEGKSTTACNLAIAQAQAGSRVLLVEADLRRPKISEYLGVDGSYGLTDVLIGQADLGSSIVSWQRGLLDFLPAGTIPPNPSELLGSRQMADLLAELRDRYDIILLDAPPLLPVTDAAIISTAADGAILVARSGRTRKEQVRHAAEALRQVNARLLGTVLNFAPQRKRRGYGDGYDYDYGYGYGYGYRHKKSDGKQGQPADTVAAEAFTVVQRQD